ncbi:unnamed protein product [Schistocephalus solidus]|uniref:Uncharacterized protein n=1 Tax=Schistocephalus solidus TaxID=70667 RepID=A0A183SA69_SCHSO|nr:unnamed protein product [Schistocephalus solidus]
MRDAEQHKLNKYSEQEYQLEKEENDCTAHQSAVENEDDIALSRPLVFNHLFTDVHHFDIQQGLTRVKRIEATDLFVVTERSICSELEFRINVVMVDMDRLMRETFT